MDFQQFYYRFILFCMCLCYLWSLSSSPWLLSFLSSALGRAVLHPSESPSLSFHFVLAVCIIIWLLNSFIQSHSSYDDVNLYMYHLPSSEWALNLLYPGNFYDMIIDIVCCCQYNYQFISSPISFIIQHKFFPCYKLTLTARKHVSLGLQP